MTKDKDTTAAGAQSEAAPASSGGYLSSLTGAIKHYTVGDDKKTTAEATKTSSTEAPPPEAAPGLLGGITSSISGAVSSLTGSKKQEETVPTTVPEVKESKGAGSYLRGAMEEVKAEILEEAGPALQDGPPPATGAKKAD